MSKTEKTERVEAKGTTPGGRRLDLTTIPNNPAWDMKRLYGDLMDACGSMGGDPALGVARACGILDDWTGRGISKMNAAFWKMTFKKAADEGNWGGIRHNPVGAVQKAITDFLLSASNMQVGRGGRPQRRTA